MSTRQPTYRLHKPTQQAVVTLNGRDIYLGKFGSTASKAEYDRLIAEWLAGGRRINPGHDLTITEFVRDYMEHVGAYYTKNGKPTSEVRYVAASMRPLIRLYGDTRAADFKPLALRAVRDAIIASDVCRDVANGRTRRIVRMFQWGVEHEKVAESVWSALRSVAGLRKGRTTARESKPVRTVPVDFVESAKLFVSPQVAAMIELQVLTGMRPGEVCTMRTCDLDMTGRVWTYVPESHKTEHHDKGRTIYIGPTAQVVLRPWLRTDLAAYLFQPRESMERFRAEQRGNRSQRDSKYHPSRRLKNPKVQPRERYSTDSYRTAVINGCRKAGVPEFHPNRLRHLAATAIRKEFGVDVARIILGHSDMKTTEIYAEADREKAMAVVGKIG